jgi:hypothetical protein
VLAGFCRPQECDEATTVADGGVPMMNLTLKILF